ncbi:MAG TPA: branched-chain amino acid ABC transporter ATP-binding protein/permease [Hyphomicrobiales bacterium]|nr:branched-chain amino acid ABC transporter ATP-binding protein/permease [Hyphomicrobiales bacterium]
MDGIEQAIAARPPRDLRWPLFAAFLAAILLYPIAFGSSYALGAGITVGLMAIATVGFVLLVGYAHQLAIGQAAFCMIGGYGSAVLTTRAGWDPLAAMLVCAPVSMIVAYVVGRPVLRLHGYALAMASLALQLILGFVVTQTTGLTGGALGINGVPKFALFGHVLDSDRAFFTFVWLVVALAVLIGLNIDRSRVGRSLKAIAASERAASSVAIDLPAHKVQMFVLSAGLASLAGSLTVHYLRVIEPNVFGLQYSLNLITAVVAGGMYSIWGGIMGAAAIVFLRETLRLASLPLLEGVIMGGLTMIVLLLFPRGIAGGIAVLSERFLGRAGADFAAMPAAEGEGAAIPPGAATAGAEEPVLVVEDASRAFGSLKAVDEVGFAVPRGSITALIGPNGAGKTTLFNLISGDQPIDSGRVLLEGRRIDALSGPAVARLGLARTFQNLELFDNLTVLENVMCGCTRRTRTSLAEVVLRLPRIGAEERRLAAEARHWLAFVGLGGSEARTPGTLPFGHQRLLEIARALALRPVLLLLDEPASGLNDSETEQLADLILRIRASGITVLLVEHDIRLVMGLADHIVVVDHGRKIAEGPPEPVRRDPQVRAAYLGS